MVHHFFLDSLIWASWIFLGFKLFKMVIKLVTSGKTSIFYDYILFRSPKIGTMAFN